MLRIDVGGEGENARRSFNGRERTKKDGKQREGGENGGCVSRRNDRESVPRRSSDAAAGKSEVTAVACR